MPLRLDAGIMIAVGLVLVAIVADFALLKPLTWRARKLNGIAQRLGKLSAPSHGAEKILNHLSAEFVQDWRAAGETLGDTRVAPVHIRDYVDPSQCYTWWPHARLSLVGSMSGILLGAGIFFTFLGITIGLRGIDTSEPGLLLSGVTQLLGGMNVAFVTSLAGILLAILWIPASGMARGRFDEALQRLSEETQRHFPWVAPAELHLRISLARAAERNELLQAQVRYSEQHAGLLRTLAVDIAEAVTGRFKTSMEETLVPAMEKLHEEFRAFAEVQVSRQQETLDQMVTQFRDGLGESLQVHAAEIALSMDEAGAHIERFHTTVGRTLEQLGQLSLTQTELLTASSEAARQFNAGVQGLAEVHDRITESATFYRESATILGELVSGIKGEAEVLRDANAELREQLAGHLDHVAGHIAQLAEATQRFESATDAMVPRLEQAVTEFTGMAADKLVEVFRTFDREMATITGHLSTTLHSLQVTMDELTPTSENLNSAVGQLIEPMTVSRAAVEQLSGDLQASQEGMKRLVVALEKVEGRVREEGERARAREAAPKPPKAQGPDARVSAASGDGGPPARKATDGKAAQERPAAPEPSAAKPSADKAEAGGPPAVPPPEAQ